MSIKQTTRDERREWRGAHVTRAYGERLAEVVEAHVIELYGVCRQSTDPIVRARMASVDELRAVVNEVFLGLDDKPSEEEGADE